MLLLVAAARQRTSKALVGCQYLKQGLIGCGKGGCLPFLTTTQHCSLEYNNIINKNNNNNEMMKFFHTLTRIPRDDAVLFSPFAASNSNNINNSSNITNYLNSFSRRQTLLQHHPFQPQQVRWKRKGGASAFATPRPPTQKQRKAHNRWKKNMHWNKVGRHSPPGSSAADRRVYEKQEYDDLMMYGTPERKALMDKYAPKASEYDQYDAILEDLMGNTGHLTSQPTPEPAYFGHQQEKYFTKVQKKMNAYLQYKEEKQRQIESGSSSSSAKSDASKDAAGKKSLKQQQESTTSIVADLALEEKLLPSDRTISLALRGFRDKFGTRQKPVGISKALQHLLKDLRLPTSLFGELTYTALLTCCRTPAEAQRIFKMQRDAQHAISAHSWSILVDVHAKLGDFEGCVQVLKDMAAEGVTPTLPAYTSLLAACYKVCSDGRIPQPVRVQAYEVGWSKWKEMRIIGLDPDVMAYGAMLRLCAVKGHPERAINLLEEMPIMDVKPTTLCFASALRAVARSQEISTRFERGWSKKNKRREQITLHHGKMARSIVYMAEGAEVEQDDGFIAALMLCAAAAGDSATAKAIYLASDVRKMDHLRTIGSNAHLMRLQGKQVPFDNYDRQPLLISGDQTRSLRMGQDNMSNSNLLMERAGGTASSQLEMLEASSSSASSSSASSSSSLTSSNAASYAVSDPKTTQHVLQTQNLSILTTPETPKPYPSFGEREYGIDTRKESALLRACAQALDAQNGLGTMWAGSENKGYLCENSLRLINARPQPKFFDSSIPGMDPVELTVASINFDEVTEGIEDLPRRARRDRLNKLDVDPDAALNIYDLDDATTNAITGRNIQKEMIEMEKREEEREERRRIRSERIKIGNEQRPPRDSSTTGGKQDADEMYFDQEEMKWKSRPRQQGGGALLVTSSRIGQGGDDANAMSDRLLARVGKFKSSPSTTVTETRKDPSDEEESYFDYEEMSWKTRPRQASHDEVRSKEAAATTTKSTEQTEEELYYDIEEMKWKTRPKEAAAPLIPKIVDSPTGSNESTTLVEGEQYVDHDDARRKTRTRRNHLTKDKVKDKPQQALSKEESIEDLLDEFVIDDKNRDYAKKISSKENETDDTNDEDVDTIEARNLLEQLHGEYSDEGTGFFVKPQSDKKSRKKENNFDVDEDELQKFLNELRLEGDDSGFDIDEIEKYANSRKLVGKKPKSKDDSDKDSNELHNFMESLGDEKKPNKATSKRQGERRVEEKRVEGFTGMDMQLQKQEATAGSLKTQRKSTAFLDDFEELASHAGLLPREPEEEGVSESEGRSDIQEERRDYVLEKPMSTTEALQMALPGLPMNRILQIRDAFKANMGNPSLLSLVPLLRENIPDQITSSWLKQMNLRNAHFAFEKAKEDGLVDIHLLNGILEVEASAGGLDRTLQLYEEEFQKHNLTPTEYSDRLVLQMLVKNDRLPRALAFKDTLEKRGRTLDIQAYGSLMEYYGRKEQLGSALLVLRECLAVHGSPPGEAYLARIRMICRREEIEKQVGLYKLIGKDPLEWLREGEATLKRERTRKGRYDVLLPVNRLLQV